MAAVSEADTRWASRSAAGSHTGGGEDGDEDAEADRVGGRPTSATKTRSACDAQRMPDAAASSDSSPVSVWLVAPVMRTATI